MAETTTRNRTKTPTEELEKVLQEQFQLLTQYRDTLSADQTLIAKLQLAELEKSNKAKTTLLLKIQAMEQARESWVKQIANQYQVRAEKIRIDDLCKVVSKDAAARLQSLKADLNEVVDSLRAMQADTQALAGSSLTWVNGSLQTLKTMITPHSTYNGQGQVDHPNMFSGRTVERRA